VLTEETHQPKLKDALRASAHPILAINPMEVMHSVKSFTKINAGRGFSPLSITDTL